MNVMILPIKSTIIITAITVNDELSVQDVEAFLRKTWECEKVHNYNSDWLRYNDTKPRMKA